MIFKITKSELYPRKKFEIFFLGILKTFWKSDFLQNTSKRPLFIKDTLDNKIMEIDTELVFKLLPEDVLPIDIDICYVSHQKQNFEFSF